MEEKEILELVEWVSMAASDVTIGILGGLSPNFIRGVIQKHIAKKPGENMCLTAKAADLLIEVCNKEVKIAAREITE